MIYNFTIKRDDSYLIYSGNQLYAIKSNPGIKFNEIRLATLNFKIGIIYSNEKILNTVEIIKNQYGYALKNLDNNMFLCYSPLKDDEYIKHSLFNRTVAQQWESFQLINTEELKTKFNLLNSLKKLDNLNMNHKTLNIKSDNEQKSLIIKDYFNKFKKQNSWFNFHKDCLYKNLSNKINIPKCFEVESINDIYALEETTFVLKSTIGFSSKEVLILTKKNDNFYCYLTKKNYTFKDIENFIQESKSQARVICEQYLGSLEEVIPLDFKCYMLNGKVKLVFVINRSAGTTVVKYFNPTTLKPINFDQIFAQSVYGFIEDQSDSYSSSLLEKIDTVIKYAEIEATKAINCNDIFLSLDFYVTTVNSQYKVWLGEITPKPGIIEHTLIKGDIINYLYK